MFRFCFMDPVDGFIELDLVKTFQDGWTIDPIRKPLRVTYIIIQFYNYNYYSHYCNIDIIIGVGIIACFSTDQEERC